MYLLLLGVIAVGAGLLLVYYSMKGKKKSQVDGENWEPDEKGKVIYLFDEEEDKSGFVDPKPEKTEASKEEDPNKPKIKKEEDQSPEKPDKNDDK